MRVYISIDMEGVAGIATPTQTVRGRDDYPAARLLMTLEANAAIGGAFDGGATSVTVNDSHGDMGNLLPEQLDPRAELVTGSPKLPNSMVQGIATEFDIGMFVGYHAGPGAEDGVLAHTYSGASFYDVRLNGQTVTETELNAHALAAYGVPLGLVTGDDKICALAEKCIPGVQTVTVKRGLGYSNTASMHPEIARAAIRGAAAEVVRTASQFIPIQPMAPHQLQVEFARIPMAELCALIPGTQRVGGRTVQFTSDNFLEVFHMMIAWMYLAAAGA